MAKAPRELPIRLIRRALLVALVGFLVSVVALYVLGRIGRPETTRSPTGSLLDEADTELQFSGEGFDYEVSRSGRKVIHVKAERVLSMKDDDYELQGVELVMIRQDEGEYSLASDSAFYNLETQAASFRGNVRFSGPRGVYLTADGLELVDDGRLIVSSSPVRFRFLDRFHGRADRLRIAPGRNFFILAGHVKVDTLQGDASPMALHCRRFVFDRDRRLLRAEGGVRLLRGDDYLRARRLSVTLSQDEKRIDFIRARWDVFGGVREPAEDGSTSIVTFEGRELSVTLEGDPEVPKKGELSSGPYGPAVLSVKDASGLRRRIKADYLVGDFVDGDLRQAQGLDNVVMDEFLDLEPEVILRSACGDTAVANFSNGQLGSFRLEGDVELHGDALQATGNQLDMADPESEVALTGTPAWAIREQGELRAPRIVYDSQSQEVRAGSPAKAILFQGSGSGVAPGGSTTGEPIRIEGSEAIWSDVAGTVSFSGEVRAWQGENFLLSDKLTGELTTSRLIASGGVKTVWRPAETDGTEDGEDGLTSKLPAEPLEVTANDLVYDQTARILTYSGEARAVQAKKIMLCQEIQVHLSEEDEFDEIICVESARLEDGETGHVVTGDRMVYRPDDERATVTGNPVVMIDGKGGRIQGKELIYDFVTGTARVRSEPLAGAGESSDEDGEP